MNSKSLCSKYIKLKISKSHSLGSIGAEFKFLGQFGVFLVFFFVNYFLFEGFDMKLFVLP